MTRADLWAWRIGTTAGAVIGVELGHAYGLSLLDVLWRAGERVLERWHA